MSVFYKIILYYVLLLCMRILLIQYKVRNVSYKKELFNKIRQCYNFVSSCLRRSEGSTDDQLLENSHGCFCWTGI